jgi:hypothetical protein
MKTFEIEIKETLSRVVKIESESLEEATAKAKMKYDDEEIVLDYNDLINTEIDLTSFYQLKSTNEFSDFILRNAEKMITNLSLEELAKIGFGSLINAKEEYEKTK